MIGILQRRYHGAGTNEPLVACQRQAGGSYARSWQHADSGGSIVAVSDASAVATIYKYGLFGEPNSWSSARFRHLFALPPRMRRAPAAVQGGRHNAKR